MIFAPLAWCMGVPWSEAATFGNLLGTKIAVNEFVGYIELNEAIKEGALSPRSAIIATYALCGFANFSSIAIQIGGIGSVAPERRSDVVGDYKPILPRLRDAKVDRVNLEFAYVGTGEPSDLALLPDHLDVGMGVVDVRGEQLQPVGQIAALAAKGVELLGSRRVALNPDCGFAPDAGEPPTIDEAYEKLERLVTAAARLRAARPSA